MSFKQAELWEAIEQPQAIRSETVPLMEEVAERYPYFQLLHTLIAKAKHDQQTPDAYDALGKAAIYAPSRRLLRQVLYDEVVAPPPAPTASEDTTVFIDASDADGPLDSPTKPIVPEEAHEVPPAPEVAPTPEASGSDQVNEEKHSALRNDLAKTLEDLRASKDQSAEQLAETEQPAEPSPKETATTEATTTDLSDTGTADEAPGEPIDETDSDSLRDNLAKTLENLRARKGQATDAQSDAPPAEPPPAAAASRTRQQEIIDRFVAANPQISREALPPDKHASDLSTTSSAFQDDLVTENLAEIMLKQGKTDKAINLYEKLMVKYPEKKAYFAQKIEQLKNT